MDGWLMAMMYVIDGGVPLSLLIAALAAVVVFRYYVFLRRG
jgi:hypothetical protein